VKAPNQRLTGQELGDCRLVSESITQEMKASCSE
jgi:hypothetical protein